LQFDTSRIPNNHTITSASLIMNTDPAYPTTRTRGATTHLVSASFDVGEFETELSLDDYDEIGGSSFGSITFLQVKNQSIIKTITLNSSGLAYINKDGLTKFGLRGSYDLSGSAPPADGLYYHKWQNGGGAEPSLSVTTEAPAGTFLVDFQISGAGSLSGETLQSVSSGGDATAVTAIPDPTYELGNWTGDVSSTSNPLTVTNVTEDMIIYANFRAKVASLGYGGAIYNDSLKVQVDGVNSNWFQCSTGTVSFNGRSSEGHPWLDTKTLVSGPTDTPVLFATKLFTDRFYSVAKFQAYEGQRTTAFVGEYNHSYSNIEYSLWRYASSDYPAQADSTGYGLHVYDPTGSYLTFSSGEKCLRYVGDYVKDCPIYSTNGDPGQSVYVTVEDAYNNYFTLSPIATCYDIFKRDYYSQWVMYYYANMMRAYNATTVEISSRYFGKDSGNYRDPENPTRHVYAAPKIILAEMSDNMS